MLRRFLAALLLSVPATAAPLAPEDAPAPLKPWVGWALRGHEPELCPFLNGQPDSKHCVWPGALHLDLIESGGTFTQTWRVYAEDWAPLPGAAGSWPQEVSVDGVPAAVLENDGHPSVRLKPGTRSISGRFRWEALPEGLEVPQETGLVRLSVAGAAVAFPARDDAGRLWVQKSRAASHERTHLELSVHRRLVDEVPLQLHTHIQLRVSGRAREEILSKALPPGFIAMSIISPLPARLDPDGRLRVQARAGTWDLEIAARREPRGDEITLLEPSGAWDADEAWAFESRDDLRGVSIEGPPTLDPQQTEMPQAWRRFPAYLMKPGATLRLVERRRGDAVAQVDRLTLDRTLWLDFNGHGFTVRDSLAGELSSWRLSMTPGTELGRVSVSGQDQFITRLASAGPAGVEVRQKTLSVEADSRIPRRRFSNPAVGWAHDFERVSGRLNLPPGWRLVHAWGVDRAAPSWVTSWTLLDLFLVLVLAFAVDRLWGRRWGLCALGTAVLTWHEPGALRWVWLWILAAEALVRGLPENRIRQAGRLARGAAWGAALLWLIPFLISQVRVGMFPQLENVSRYGGWNRSVSNGFAAAKGDFQSPPAAAPQREMMDEAAPEENTESDATEAGSAGAQIAQMAIQSSGYLKRSAKSNYASVRNLLALDPKQAVSTGPGVPTWTWRSVALTWRGPVRKEQRLRLWLIGPQANLGLSFLRVGLSVILILLFMGLPVEQWAKALLSREGARHGLRWLFPALLFALAPPSASAQLPTPEMLQELSSRLLAAPDCSPNCAESPRLRLEVADGILRARIEIHAAAATAVPLPAGGRAWSPVSIILDGAPAPGVRREQDGTLWLPVGPGAHQILLEGPLPDSEVVPLPLPLKSRRVEASIAGWTLHGLREDGRADDSLQLARQRSSPGPSSPRAGGTLPPFVRVERTLRLGLSWEVETRVSRLTPVGAPVIVEVPLIPGESVTSDLAVKKGKVQVSLGPQAAEAVWTSVLAESDTILLQAPDAVPWVEAWRLEAGPLWHAEAILGIPHVRSAGEARALAWRPWPGESVTLALTRPAGVSGRTLTIDAATLDLSPGARATDAALQVQLRSSRGAQHAFTLPAGAELRSSAVDGTPLSASLEEGRLVVPIQPGAHSVSISWREPRGLGPFFRASRVGLNAAAVNARVHINMPADRWTLLAGGPRLGPAVLFWSLLAIFLLISAGLGRLELTPLGWRQWFLLSIGLSQVPVPAAALVACWLVMLGWRGKNPRPSPREFDALQVALAALSVAALLCLFSSIKRGLLGQPDMQIGGNESSAALLRWYKDRTGNPLPRPWVFSVPLGVYRLAMLAWALWLANALLGWLKWGWGCLGKGGLWKPLRPPVPDLPPAPMP